MEPDRSVHPGIAVGVAARRIAGRQGRLLFRHCWRSEESGEQRDSAKILRGAQNDGSRRSE